MGAGEEEEEEGEGDFNPKPTDACSSFGTAGLLRGSRCRQLATRSRRCLLPVSGSGTSPCRTSSITLSGGMFEKGALPETSSIAEIPSAHTSAELS